MDVHWRHGSCVAGPKMLPSFIRSANGIDCESVRPNHKTVGIQIVKRELLIVWRR